MGKKKRRDIEGHEGSLLPEREALSIPSTGASPLSPTTLAGLESLAAGAPSTADPVADTATTTSESAQSELVSAEASATESESVTDEDRSEHFSATDTASAES
jgi:hypothetical protein